MLEILSDFQVSIPELGTIKAKHIPSVILTSNNTRDLSEALKRRALYLYMDYPTHERELQIVKNAVPELNARTAQQAVEMVQNLRTMDLKKQPSISETIDWAKALVMLNASQLDRTVLETTLTVLLKHESDVQKARQMLNRGDERDHPTNRRRN